MKQKFDRDLTIVRDFLKYTLYFFVPFFLLAVVHGLVYQFTLMNLFVNPMIYSVGISLIIVVIIHDIDEILALFGLAKEPQLSPDITYSREIQEISVLISRTDFDTALKKVNLLLKKEPNFPAAYNMKGEILLRGFEKYKEARKCFDKALQFSKAGDEQNRLATALRTSTFR